MYTVREKALLQKDVLLLISQIIQFGAETNDSTFCIASLD